MTDRDSQDYWRRLRLAVPGPRTRMIVAMICCLLSVGAPVVVLGVPGRTVDRHAAGPLADPAGLGVTGTLPGDPLPGDAVPSVAPSGVPGGVPGDSVGAGPPGIPTPPNLPDGPLGIPGVMLDAYQFAERTLAQTQPGCHLSWSVLAGIGRIESDHASDGRVDAFGNTLGPILGPRLDGSPGMAAIADTDRGVLDGDPVWDRAVGPMQFIPSSWRSYGVDGNGDRVVNPNNIYDATVTTGRYLCAGGGDLSNPAQQQAAVFRYNHSATYVTIVLQWAQAYLSGVVPTPSAPGPVPPGTNGHGGAPILVDGAPRAAQAAAALAATSQPAPPPVTPSPVTTPPVMPSPVTTPPVMPSPVTTPLVTPSPVATLPVTPSPVTATTAPPATDSGPPHPTPSPPAPSTTTTTPVEPASRPAPPPPLAGP